MRGTLLRTGRAATVAMRAAARMTPRRSVGAVQGPTVSWPAPVHIKGWVGLGSEEAVTVLVTVNGRYNNTASLGDPPLDVVEAWSTRGGIAPQGWEALVDLSPYAEQTVALGATAIGTSGIGQKLHGLRIRVRTTLLGAIDEPEPGTVLEARHVVVSGWAMPPRCPLGRVELLVDGRSVGLARPLASPRPDIAAIRQAAGAPLAGFEHTVVLDGDAGTPVRIDALVTDSAGNATALPHVDVVLGEVADTLNSAPAPNHLLPAVEISTSDARTNDPLRLVVFTHRLDIGGGQLYLQDLLRALLEHDDVCCVVVSEIDGSLRGELEALGARIEITSYPIGDHDEYEERVHDLVRLVDDHAADVVVVNTMGAGIGADVALRAGVPAVWAVHESFTIDDYFFAAYGEDGIDPLVRERVVDALAATAAVVFEADATRTTYAGDVDGRRFATVRYGIELADIAAYRRRVDVAETRHELGLSDDDDVVLCIATFEPRKGQALLATAFAEVATEFPDARLVLVGDTANRYAAALREVVERIGLGARIRLEPVVPDPFPWYAAADVFAIASDVESMPRSLIEAMAFGLPIVATKVWGVPELVDDGRTGVLFEPRDVSAAVGALRRVLAMPAEERARFSNAGAATVQEHHDARGYVDAYRRLLFGLADDPTALPHDLLGS